MHEALAASQAGLQAERAQRLNEERFRSLVQSSARIAWISGPTGQSREESEDDGWLDAIHPDDRARAGAAWEASIRTLAPCESEFRMRMADGGYRWTVARGHPIRGADGTVREWVGTASDIHDRQTAEDASRKWRRRLEAILEAGDVGTWTLDPGSERFHADENSARLYGIPAESLPRILDMFTQVGWHPEQEAGGLGIGLHLVRQVTERHGGTVRAKCAGPGQGAASWSSCR